MTRENKRNATVGHRSSVRCGGPHAVHERPSQSLRCETRVPEPNMLARVLSVSNKLLICALAHLARQLRRANACAFFSLRFTDAAGEGSKSTPCPADSSASAHCPSQPRPASQCRVWLSSKKRPPAAEWASAEPGRRGELGLCAVRAA